MSVINGTDVRLYVPSAGTATDDASTTWIAVGSAKSGTLSISADTPDSSTKDSSGWLEVIAGQKSWTMDFDGLVDFTGTIAAGDPNITPLFTYMNDRTQIKVAFGKDGYFMYGNGFISSLEETADMEQPVSLSGSIAGTGALTYVSDGSSVITAASSYPNG